MSQRSRLEKLEKKLDTKSNSSEEQPEVTDEEGLSSHSQQAAETLAGQQKTSEDLKEEYYRLARQLEMLKKTKSPVQQRNSEKPEAQKKKSKGKQTHEEIRLQSSQLQNQSNGRYQMITHSVSVEESNPRLERRQQQRGQHLQSVQQQSLFQHSQNMLSTPAIISNSKKNQHR